MNERERNDLLISWITISIAFAWVLSNFSVVDFFSKGAVGKSDFVDYMIVSLVAVGTGFVCHELMHRHFGKKFGAHAEYRMWPHTLALALVFAVFFGVVFAAPGAVYIYGENITRKQNGIISLAGPLTNVAVAIFFFLLFVLSIMFFPLDILLKIGFIGMYINLLLAFFNLLPIWQLDGAKVFVWNPLIWAAVFVPVALVTLPLFLFS